MSFSVPSSLPVAPRPPTDLERAMDLYHQTFGHGVPGTVAALFAAQPGPLTLEIRQAIALGRPVAAWRKAAHEAERSFATL